MKKTRVLKTWSKRNVPDDVWPEVLSRLPVKSLLRFRSVCRSWRAVIDDPDFARLHLARFNNNRLESHLFVVQGTYMKEECVVRCSKTLRTTARLGFLRTDIQANCVICAIDGLFVLKNSMPDISKLVLWNPSIRKTHAIPPFLEFSSEVDNLEFGLGFDPSIKDYKFVRFAVQQRMSLTQRIGVLFVGIYTVGTNSWKRIEFQGDGCLSWREEFIFPSRRIVCLRGVLYALAKDERSSPLKLVSFDLSSELFASVGLPIDDSPQSHLYSQTLTVTDGGCSLAVVNLSKPKGSIWVLQSLGCGSNSLIWTQRYSFETVIPKYVHFAWISRLLYLKKDGDDIMLLKFRNMVISYNLETHRENIVLKKNLHDGYTWPYIESLIFH